MPEVALHNLAGEKVGTVTLPKALEGPADTALLWQAVRMALANQRQGTADTKTRGEVSGGGRKPWRQKHTGRARHGSIRSPIWRKGGIVFGPHPRDYRYPLPQQLRRKALVEGLKAKLGDEGLVAVESLEGLESKTKAVAKFLKGMNALEGALLVVDRPNPSLARLCRNLRRVAVKAAPDLNCYDLLLFPRVVATPEALKQLEAMT
ncbi:MAG: 50S ribosomal protein L4 [Candidatus Omnitrophica bacterium]|nr:50S ribosomal protein L4 [Candidatus Omnitrophota bacterium]